MKHLTGWQRIFVIAITAAIYCFWTWMFWDRQLPGLGAIFATALSIFCFVLIAALIGWVAEGFARERRP